MSFAAIGAAHATVVTPVSPSPASPCMSACVPVGGLYRVEFRGLGDKLFLVADLNTASQVANIRMFAGQPHSYFQNEYASIKVENAAGVVYPGCYKSIIGSVKYPASSVNCPLRMGDFVSITHQEPYGGYATPLTGTTSLQRLHVFDALSGLILPKANTVRYQVAPGGALVPFSSSDAYIASTPYPTPSPIGPAKAYRIEFRGLGNTPFMLANLDMTNRLMSIQTNYGQPHPYFKQEYASITVDSATMGRVCHRSFVGNQTYQAGVQNCPFFPGDFVTVKHLEPYESIGRLQVYDTYFISMLPRGHVARYQAGFDGILRAVSIIP
ncbi:MAG: hypothetical protein LBP58_08910 [Azoarcus sp.]|nr:hypothetical protein [Azoarcus sp.]